MPSGPLRRALQGQTVVDASWALANNREGSFDRWLSPACMAPALVTALVVTAAFGGGRRLHVGAETAGMLASQVPLWHERSVVLAVLAAALVTALVRATI